MWQHWTNGILGLVVLVVPFLGIAGSALTWTLVIVGLLIAIFGFWGASEKKA
jgi:VIT1/CCC1 family predicted Fe2+/Mn2+ transporter